MTTPRPTVVPEETTDGAAEFEVDSHGAQSAYVEEPTREGAPTGEVPDAGIPTIAIGWTPQEATQLICAIFNFGMLVYGPEWAADPRETEGWNISAAQLLDQVLPKGTGGYVELGAGLIMVGNGLAMMTVRRVPLIQRGPRPMWGRPKVEADIDAPAPPAATPPAAKKSDSNGGSYRIPRDLVPPAQPDFHA